MLRITNYINKTPIWIGVFILLAIHYLGFYLNPNEEMYLLLSKQFFNPNFIPNSFNLNQFPSNRLMYQCIVGYLLENFSFEQTALIGKASLCLLFAFPIAKIIKSFELSLLEALFILQVFFLAHQSFFADAWIFLSFEAKSISYVFVLWGMYYLLQNKLTITILFLVIATWFHVLVGGWSFLLVLLYMIFQKNSFRQLLLLGSVYTVLIAPLIWYLAQEIFVNTQTVINGINIDWIYTSYRNPHHTRPFQQWSTFSPGIFSMLIWGVLCFSFFTKLDHPVLKKINLFNLLTISLLFIFLCIAWFDQNGTFTKFYPFRPSALLKFFILMEVAMVIKLWVVLPNFLPYLNTIFLLFLLPMFVPPTTSLIKSYQPPSPKEQLWNDFTSHIRQNTPKDAVFINYPIGKDYAGDLEISFHRKAEREIFISYKMVPSGGAQIYDWYIRLQERNKLVNNLNYLATLQKKYPVDYLITYGRMNQETLELKYNNEQYFLYKIKN